MPDPIASRTLVALATYNELENLPPLVDAIRQQLPDADVLVVDDNSPDGTGDWCDAFAKDHPWFSCLHRAGKLGLGSATWAAMQHAIQRPYDWLITLDADWSHPPDALPRMVAASPPADVVIGSRYCPGGAVAGWPRRRQWISKGVNAAATRLAGLPARDCSTAYRMYRTSVLGKLDFSKLQATGYAYLEEILWHLAHEGARVVEVPITFSERRAGASKVTVSEAWGKLAILSRLAWKRLGK